MKQPVIQSVADTAFMVAWFRAMETERPDALFRDPLAAEVAGEEGRRFAQSLGRYARFGAWSLAIRTVVIDDLVKSAERDVVLSLGAGLDTRPYRLDLPHGVRWIESPLPRPFMALLALRARFMSRERREKMRRALGYVVLEPVPA